MVGFHPIEILRSFTNLQFPPNKQRRPPTARKRCWWADNPKEIKIMSLGTILLIVLILMLVGALPSWPHSRKWGYAPSGGLGLVLVILVILVLLGRI